MNILNKLKRELYTGLSKICVRYVPVNYMGLKMKAPLLYGMGRGYIIPAEFWMSRCLEAFLNLKKGVVIDVGVNVGVYLVKLRAIDKDRPYYGFEPNPACNYYTYELIRSNKFENAYIFPFALSSEQQIRRLYASKRGDKTASIHKFAKEGERVEFSLDIVTQNGDEFVRRLGVDDISVIKIDVEGAELEVLKGLNQTIAKYRPFIYCEVWDLPDETDNWHQERKQRLLQIYDLLTAMDYVILGVLDNYSIHKIESVDEMKVPYLPEYIISPAEKVEELQDKLKNN